MSIIDLTRVRRERERRDSIIEILVEHITGGISNGLFLEQYKTRLVVLLKERPLDDLGSGPGPRQAAGEGGAGRGRPCAARPNETGTRFQRNARRAGAVRGGAESQWTR